MKLWQSLLLVILLIAFSFLTACGPSQAEQQRAYEEQVKEAVKAHQEQLKEQERQEVRAWVVYVKSVIENDVELKVWWNDFHDKYEGRVTTESIRQQQEELFYSYISKYETLYAEVSSFPYPASCQKAHQALLDYLSKQRPMVTNLIHYYQTGTEWYRIESNDKLMEAKGLRQQFFNECNKIAEEWEIDLTWSILHR